MSIAQRVQYFLFRLKVTTSALHSGFAHRNVLGAELLYPVVAVLAVMISYLLMGLCSRLCCFETTKSSSHVQRK